MLTCHVRLHFLAVYENVDLRMGKGAFHSDHSDVYSGILRFVAENILWYVFIVCVTQLFGKTFAFIMQREYYDFVSRKCMAFYT